MPRTYLGRHFEFSLHLDDGTTWTANVGDEAGFTSIEVGTRVHLKIDPAHVIIFAGASR
jgi:hypothetical protein